MEEILPQPIEPTPPGSLPASSLMPDTLPDTPYHTHNGTDGSPRLNYNNLLNLPTSMTPTAHATSHQSGGSDAIKLDDLAAPDDNTDLNASTTKHGLAKKGSGTSTDYYGGDNDWHALPSSPAAYFRLLLPSGGVLLGTASTNVQISTDADGSNIYVTYYDDAATDSIRIYRYAKDANSSLYVYSGTATLVKGTDFGGSGNSGVTAGSTYVWVVTINTAASDIQIYRYNKDLTGKQAITITSGSWPFSLSEIGYCGINSSDTSLYVSANGNSGFAVYTISGTNATTTGSAITRTSSLTTVVALYFDGTYLYQMDYNSTNDLKKYNTSGTLQSTTTTNLFGVNTTVDDLGSPVGIGYGGTSKIYLFSLSKAPSTANRYFLNAYLITKP